MIARGPIRELAVGLGLGHRPQQLGGEVLGDQAEDLLERPGELLRVPLSLHGGGLQQLSAGHIAV
jgi:hypothetical protein